MPIQVVKHYELWIGSLRTPPAVIKVPGRAWEEYFPEETLRLAAWRRPDSSKISIDDVSGLAFSLPASAENNRDLFIATMMWGRGPTNGRMMPKFKEVMSHAEFDQTLNASREEVAQGHVREAYQVWSTSRIQGMRESFFTKWLFVCGLSNDSGVLRTFTLDSHVRASLRTLGWPDSSLRREVRGEPSFFYEAYVKAVYGWAAELSKKNVRVTPLEVEQFLFRKNGDVPLA